jgi:hypothetical protein
MQAIRMRRDPKASLRPSCNNDDPDDQLKSAGYAADTKGEGNSNFHLPLLWIDMMSYQRRTLALVALFAVVCFTIISTGCVSPMGCGNNACGPISIAGCGGCGECGGAGDCEGCGELYVDPWINHPPTSDPCDCCGNHNGQSCGRCRGVYNGFASLWGYRRHADTQCGSCGPLLSAGGCGPSCDGCSSCGGDQCSDGVQCSDGAQCSSCGDVGVSSDSGTCSSCAGGALEQQTVRYANSPVYSDGEVVVDSDEGYDMPVAQSYQPSRERKIFRPAQNMSRAKDAAEYR